MNLSQLPKITERGKKRVGRGIGSGKGGHTSGRGQKGQKARNKVPVYFMGAATGASLIKRLPYLRGKGKLKPTSDRPLIVNVQYLNLLPAKTVVSVESLAQYNIIVLEEGKAHGVKLLGGGKLGVALTVALPVSKGAREQIEKAGGTVGGEKEQVEKKKQDKKVKK